MADSIITGVTQEQINEWKSKYGEIWLENIGGESFVYRPMKRFEFKTLMNTPEANKYFNEEKIVQQCTIHPAMDVKTMPTMKAGTIATLVELIMAASNFGVMEEPIKL